MESEQLELRNMQRQPRTRLRVCVFTTGVTLVSLGALCLIVTTGAGIRPAALSNDAQHSPQCETCLNRVHSLHQNEHDALASEQDKCRRSATNCADACGTTKSDCKKNCHLDEYKCTHDAADRHTTHLAISGRIDDRHECHQVCSGVSSQCEQCLSDVHTTRDQAHLHLATDLESCNARLATCYSRCEKNDKRCRISCDDVDKQCRTDVKQRDRSHLTLQAMVEDHHHCKALCEVTMS